MSMENRGRGQRSLRPTNRVETAKIGANVLLFFSGDKKICYSFLFVFSFLVYPFESFVNLKHIFMILLLATYSPDFKLSLIHLNVLKRNRIRNYFEILMLFWAKCG